ncbi:hypothetical protein GCM10009788_43710 [Nocardioides humi]|uniref:Disease resistance R13L4/SHOC-2-like LRR domain-containing protein n=1 Tax=Nocardioides humi TaxID=449461 RepID=A0ABN2BB54_9ACTN
MLVAVLLVLGALASPGASASVARTAAGGACTSAKGGLTAAEESLATAQARVAKARKQLTKARASRTAAKVAKAKKRLRLAKHRVKSAAAGVPTAQSAVASACATPAIPDPEPGPQPSAGCVGQSSIPVLECNALMALKDANPGGTGLGDWGTGDPCAWGADDVICAGGHVQYLALQEQGLTVLPDPIEDLTQLRILALAGNELTTLPASIGRLTNLEVLGLGGNRLTSVPDAIGSLGRLQDLDLYGNRLSGDISGWAAPLRHAHADVVLDLSGNRCLSVVNEGLAAWLDSKNSLDSDGEVVAGWRDGCSPTT